jgi:hypothetical protein
MMTSAFFDHAPSGCGGAGSMLQPPWPPAST